jgi:hypothetical protein
MKVLFTAVLMLCLALDLGDPALPGVPTCNVDDSVEVVQLQRHSPAPAATVAADPAPVAVRAAGRVAALAVRRHAVPRRTGVMASIALRRPASDPSSPEEG